MISAVGAQQGVQQNAYVSSVAATQEAAEATAVQVAEQTEKVERVDTVQISQQGRDAVKMATQQATVSAAADETGTVTLDSDSALKRAAEKVEKVAEESTKTAGTDSTDETSTTDSDPVLTSLTEQELDKLVSEGSITSNQKNAELARRQAAQETATQSANVQEAAVEIIAE